MNTQGICKHFIQWEFCEECNGFCGIKDTQLGYDRTQKGYIEPELTPILSCGINIATSDGGSSSYYDLPPDCQTLQDVIVKKGMDFTRGNIFKAAYRWDVKPGLVYNLEKIKWFAQDALNRIYAEERKKARGPSD